MSRFGKLEFETGPDSSGQQSLRPAAGETHWSSEAERAFCLGDFELALRLFARVLEHNPTSVPAWAGQVRSLIELGEFREARLWADKALERFPQAPELLAAKAVALGRLGDNENAIAFSDESIEERGDSAYVWLARGDVFLSRREKQADHCFERARSVLPSDWTCAWLTGRIRRFHGQFAKALQSARDACSLAPGEISPWLLAGDCQLLLSFHDEARVSFTQAWQIQPDSLAASDGLRRSERPGFFVRCTGVFRRFLRS